jgi:hypothetical protein
MDSAQEARVTVRIDTVGLCDDAALAWIEALTGIVVRPPNSGDGTFTLHDPGPGLQQAAPLAQPAVERMRQAEELVRLHAAMGGLCARARYLSFTLWRLADGRPATQAATPDHPHLRIDPETTAPGRVFTALAAGVRGTSRAALRWSPDALADFARALTSQVWETRAAHEVEVEVLMLRPP